MAVFDSLETLNSRRKKMRRRTFVSVILAGGAAWLGYRWWKQRPQALAQRATRYTTQNRDFYLVSIHKRYPRVDLDHWRLLVRTPAEDRSYSLEELVQLGRVDFPKTLACISNPLGGTAIGNANWTGIPLAGLLERPGDDGDEEWRVVFRGLDGFHSSVPYQIAADSRSALAYQMNGKPLSREHGFPLRVLLPGKFGMKQPRWLQEIELTTERARGYWESRGWSETADLRPMSRIDSAQPQAGGQWMIKGIAACGASKVGRVEVSVDEGPWKRASITSPAEPDAWVTWRHPWKPDPGEHLLAVRVFDAAGRAQEEGFSGAFPSGSTGIHRVYLAI